MTGDRMTMNLFDDPVDADPRQEILATGATILRRFAVPDETAILAALNELVAQAPFRHMTTPGHYRMSVAIYEPGAKLSLHQDKDERDLDQPIVSVSLGIPAVFLFGGLRRADKAMRVHVTHGDVVVWGGPARLRYHGVLPLKESHHPLVGNRRINLSFRKAA